MMLRRPPRTVLGESKSFRLFLGHQEQKILAHGDEDEEANGAGLGSGPLIYGYD